MANEVDAPPVNPGSALVAERWKKTTKAQRLEVAMMLVAARSRKAKGTVRSKRAKSSKRNGKRVK